MAYTADCRVETERTIMNKVETTHVEAHYRFDTEEKIERKADGNFGLNVRMRIARRLTSEDPSRFPSLKSEGTIGQYLRDREGLSQKESENKIYFSNDRFKVGISYLTFNALAFDLCITAKGRVELEDLIDFDDLNEFVLTGRKDLLKKPSTNKQVEEKIK